MSGEGLSGNIHKGPVHTRIDEVVDARNAHGVFEKRSRFLEALKDWRQDYFQILEDHVGVPHGQANYLRNSWYNTDQAPG